MTKRQVPKVSCKVEYFTGCPNCGVWINEDGLYYDCSNCGQRIRKPGWDMLKEDWRFRLCPGKRGIINIAAINRKTRAIGRMRIPEWIFDKLNDDTGQTMEEVNEEFGQRHN